MNKKRIALIILYFGQLPQYIDVFFKSLEFNPDIDIILFTDQTLDVGLNNLIINKISFEEIRERIQNKFEFKIFLNKPYKLCDYKPAYGYIFEEELKEYDFWGHCDFDQVLGDLMKFLNNDILQKYDKIYQHGHLCLYKNTIENNKRFMIPVGMDYKEVFTTNVICVFDEVIGMQNKYDLLGVDTYKNRDCVDILPWHDKFLRVESYLSEEEKINFNYKDQVFFWENGKIYRAAVQNNNIIYNEFNYLHFQKRNLIKHFEDINKVEAFYITKDGFYHKNKGFNITIEDIKKYNGFNLKSELSKRMNYHYFILNRRINKYLRNK